MTNIHVPESFQHHSHKNPGSFGTNFLKNVTTLNKSIVSMFNTPWLTCILTRVMLEYAMWSMSKLCCELNCTKLSQVCSNWIHLICHFLFCEVNLYFWHDGIKSMESIECMYKNVSRYLTVCCFTLCHVLWYP